MLKRRSPTAIAAAIGLDRKTVRKHLRELPALTYARGWRPIRRDYLAVRLPVAARVLASHIARRGEPAPGAYLPTLDDYAADLGWLRSRVQRALARCVRGGLVVESATERRGSRIRKRRKAGTVSGETRVRSAGKHGYGQRGKTGTVPVQGTSPIHPSPGAPNRSLTNLLRRLPPMDGWRAPLSESVREKLRPGADPASVFAVLTAAGIYQRDEVARWRFARGVCERGWSTETVLGLLEAAHEPTGSEGRVRAPAALLRTWLEGPVEARRPPLPVGPELAATRAERQREAAARLRQAAELELAAQRFAELVGELPVRERARRARDLGIALRSALLALDGDARHAAQIELDRCGTLADLLAFTAQHPELDCASWLDSGGASSSNSPKP